MCILYILTTIIAFVFVVGEQAWVRTRRGRDAVIVAVACAGMDEVGEGEMRVRRCLHRRMRRDEVRVRRG
jgi:hypothetical protein